MLLKWVSKKILAVAVDSTVTIDGKCSGVGESCSRCPPLSQTSTIALGPGPKKVRIWLLSIWQGEVREAGFSVGEDSLLPIIVETWEISTFLSTLVFRGANGEYTPWTLGFARNSVRCTIVGWLKVDENRCDRRWEIP